MTPQKTKQKNTFLFGFIGGLGFFLLVLGQRLIGNLQINFQEPDSHRFNRNPVAEKITVHSCDPITYNDSNFDFFNKPRPICNQPKLLDLLDLSKKWQLNCMSQAILNLSKNAQLDNNSKKLKAQKYDFVIESIKKTENSKKIQKKKKNKTSQQDKTFFALGSSLLIQGVRVSESPDFTKIRKLLYDFCNLNSNYEHIDIVREVFRDSSAKYLEELSNQIFPVMRQNNYIGLTFTDLDTLAQTSDLAGISGIDENGNLHPISNTQFLKCFYQDQFSEAQNLLKEICTYNDVFVNIDELILNQQEFDRVRQEAQSVEHQVNKDRGAQKNIDVSKHLINAQIYSKPVAGLRGAFAVNLQDGDFTIGLGKAYFLTYPKTSCGLVVGAHFGPKFRWSQFQSMGFHSFLGVGVCV